MKKYGIEFEVQMRTETGLVERVSATAAAVFTPRRRERREQPDHRIAG